MRVRRKAAEAAREAIRATLVTIRKKERKPLRKQLNIRAKGKIANVTVGGDFFPAVEEINNKSSTSTQLSVREISMVETRSKSNCSESEEEVGAQMCAADSFYYTLKQLPEKILVRLPAGIVRDAAEHLKNVSYETLAGFIIFRTDLHPVPYRSIKKVK